MQFAMDTHALMTAGLLDLFLLGALMALISRWRPKEVAFSYWAAGTLLLAVGLLLVGLRVSIPDLWSAAGGNSLLIVAMLAFFEGLRRFLGHRRFARLSIAILLLGVIGEIVLLFGWNDPNVQAILFSLIAAGIAGRFIFQVLSDIPAESRSGAIFTGIFWILLAILMVFRSIYLLAVHPMAGLLQNDLVQTITFIGVVIAVNGWSFGFVLMVNEKSEFQLRAAESELERLAITDPLTGAYNRRHFYHLGQHEFETSRRYVRSMAIIMLDIDHLDQINATFGHLSGDQVLAWLAHNLNNYLRRPDVLCRFGGEEFAILLPETDLAAALQTAERLRNMAATLRLEDYPSLSLSISLGVTCLQPGDRSFEDLIQRADHAMHTAKKDGRDRVAGS